MIDFVIVANKRTGSTFLQEALNSHPSITCYDELFLNKNKSGNSREEFDLFVDKRKEKEVGITVQDYLKGIPTNGITGFKVVYPQLYKWKELEECIKRKWRRKRIKVIHLIRSNWFEQSMSWHTKGIDYDSRDVSLYIDPVQLKNRMEQVKEETELFRDKFQCNNYTEIFYEDMFGRSEGNRVNIKRKGSFNITSNQVTYLNNKYKKAICKFFNVNNYNMYSNLTKRTRFDIWKYIENKEEIQEVIRQC